MSWLQIARKRVMLLSGASLAIAGTAALTVSALVQPAAAADAIPAARQAALIQATAGASANEVEAVGDEAKLINAAMPFSDAPVIAARAFPKSLCGVVYQRNSTPVCQFTFVCDGSLYRQPAAAAWKQAEQIARAALAGYVERSVGAATHYHADYVAPAWAPMLTKISKLGTHIFYRWPGAWGQPGAFSGRYIGEPRDPASMRPAVNLASLATEDGEAVAAGPITDGTQLGRAPTDVGGLLDISKGWTLTIPMPAESASASQRIAESQRALAPATPQNDADTQSRVIASR